MKLKHFLIGIAVLFSFFIYSCDCGCEHGTDAGAFFACECDCYGNWTGSKCDGCLLICSNGGVPDDYCETCVCPEGFAGPKCDSAIGDQYITLTLVDESGSFELERNGLTLTSADDINAKAQYIHPATNDTFELRLEISDSTIASGFYFISAEDKYGTYLRNVSDNNWFDPVFGELSCVYDQNKNLLTGSYFLDLHSTYTGKNISISGNFQLFH